MLISSPFVQGLLVLLCRYVFPFVSTHYRLAHNTFQVEKFYGKKLQPLDEFVRSLKECINYRNSVRISLTLIAISPV